MESQSLHPFWFVVFNPASGNGKGQKKFSHIKALMKKYGMNFKIVKTHYPYHEAILVHEAVLNGFYNIICIGGDGTLHHMVNGLMLLQENEREKVRLAVIPTGTGNDWVKNYNIPIHPEKAIKIITNNKCFSQDIGQVTLIDEQKKIYFHNAAGIGFDAYVVKNVHRYKKWGKLAYLFTALSCFKKYPIKMYSIICDGHEINAELLMISLGLCQYSGSGMQLTDYKNHISEHFDMTLIKSISLNKIIRNIFKLYQGKIDQMIETNCSQVRSISIKGNSSAYIQADGELLGKGNAKIILIPNAISFVIS